MSKQLRLDRIFDSANLVHNSIEDIMKKKEKRLLEANAQGILISDVTPKFFDWIEENQTHGTRAVKEGVYNHLLKSEINDMAVSEFIEMGIDEVSAKCIIASKNVYFGKDKKEYKTNLFIRRLHGYIEWKFMNRNEPKLGKQKKRKKEARKVMAPEVENPILTGAVGLISRIKALEERLAKIENDLY